MPFENGKNLYEAQEARGLAHAPLWSEGKGHNNLPHMPGFVAVRGLLDHLSEVNLFFPSGPEGEVGKEPSPGELP